MPYLGDLAELDIITASRPPDIAPDLPVRVHLGLGHGSDVLYVLYRGAVVFVLPSQKRANAPRAGDSGSPHDGLPVVACNVGAVPELVIDGHNGILVPPGDVPDLARALKTLVVNPELRETMGAHGLGMAQREHDAARNAGQVFELMRYLANSHRS